MAELAELELPPQIKLKCETPDCVMRLKAQVQPTDGYWTGGTFTFSIVIPYGYPHDPPKVRCEQKVGEIRGMEKWSNYSSSAWRTAQIYHPNINVEGAVCLNILRDEWRPILSIYTILIGLLHLFLEPEVFEPLNQEAANVLSNNPCMFAGYVRDSMRGWSDGVAYDCVLDTKESF